MKTKKFIRFGIVVMLMFAIITSIGCARSENVYGLNEPAKISLGNKGEYEICLSNIRDSRNAVLIDCTYNNTSEEDIDLEYQGFVAYNKNGDRLKESETNGIIKAGTKETITLVFQSNLTKKRIRLEYYSDVESGYESDATFVIKR